MGLFGAIIEPMIKSYQLPFTQAKKLQFTQTGDFGKPNIK